MSERQQALQQKSDNEISEPVFDHRYDFVMKRTVQTLNDLSQVHNREQIMLPILGTLLMTVSFIFTVVGNAYGRRLLTTVEFLVIFLIGTLLLILGSYFRAKDLRMQVKTVEKSGENFMKGWKAHTGPLNRQGYEYNEGAGSEK